MKRRKLRDVSLGGARRAYAERVDNVDGTVDLIGVEIMAAGGPIHGVGSPPEGDYWTVDDLRAMALADEELGDELRPPNKIGHDDDQALVRNSIAAGELPAPTEGEMPAVGWVENVRVNGEKLLGDLMRVPKAFADLLDKGAWRTRSVELASVTSQTTGKTYDWVVTGLAWLGGKMPAVRTLGDVVALYEGDIPIRRRFMEERDLEVVWEPDSGLEYLRDLVYAAINPVPGEMSRYWVRDVQSGKALIEDYSDSSAWVVPFEVQDGRAVLAASTEWARAEQQWVSVGRANEERLLTLRESRPDSRAMKFSEAQKRKFAEATGVEVTKVTDKMLEDAGVQPEPESGTDDTPSTTTETTTSTTTTTEGAPDDKDGGDTSPAERENAELRERVKKLEEDNRLERRNAFVKQAIRIDKKCAPGQRKDLEDLFDANEEQARKFVASLPSRDDLDEQGADDDELDGGSRSLEEANREYTDEAAARLGIPKEALV